MNKVIMFIGAILLSSTSILAQDASLVQYDPLFWKDQLKLDRDQCQKIKEINSEYYQSLFAAYEEKKGDRNALKKSANKSLLQRNQEIWETFHPKQRKRWKRIWHASTSKVPTNES
ncbi:MAG TPA: hypothetical protein VFZ52_13685 [Chryseolinea sp.]